MKKATVLEIEEQVEKYKGNIAAIARHFGVSRGTIYNRMADSSQLKKAIEDAQETFVDDVESALYDNALSGNVAAQIFIMKAHPKAKKRGWSERSEIANSTTEEGDPIPFRIVDYRAGFTETEG